MKVPLSKCKFWSFENQALVFMAFQNGSKINFKEQLDIGIYKNQRSFNEAMELLCDKGVFKKINNEYFPDFELLFNGRFLIDTKIIPLDINE